MEIVSFANSKALWSNHTSTRKLGRCFDVIMRDEPPVPGAVIEPMSLCYQAHVNAKQVVVPCDASVRGNVRVVQKCGYVLDAKTLPLTRISSA